MDALLGTMTKFDCKMGVFLSIEPPTRPMLATVAAAGDVTFGAFKFPVLQTLTIAQIFFQWTKMLSYHLITLRFRGQSSPTKGKSVAIES